MRFSVVLFAAALTAVPAALTAADHRPLLDALDWEHPLLKEIAPIWRSGDRARTEKLLAEHFRSRGADRSPIVPRADFKRQKADEVVAGDITVAGTRHRFPDGRIDWKLDPSGNGTNLEFTAQLNRMRFWKTLGEAYRATGDEKYARTFAEQFRSWRKTMPRPVRKEGAARPDAPAVRSDFAATTGWRSIDVGVRLKDNWPTAFRLMGNSPSLTDDDVLDFLASSLEQMRFSLQHPAIGNWLTMQMNGVFRFASEYPEFRESAAARRQAVRFLAAGFHDQLLPDGFQYELSPMYHNVAIGNSLELVATARRCGVGGEFPPGFLADLRKGYEALVALMTPAGGIPLLGDSGPLQLSERYGEKLQSCFPDHPLFRWVASQGREGTPPKYTSVLLPWAGYIAMRTDWSPRANLLVFDVGMPGRSHIHQDKLNLVLFSGREELIFDDGGGKYEKNKFRAYSLSALSHNTCVVDGKGQLRDTSDRSKCVPRAPVPCVFETTPEADFAEASYDEGYGEVGNRIATHTRQITFLKPDIVLVLDRLVPRDDREHAYQLRWQLKQSRVRPLLPKHPAVRSAGRHAEVIVAPLLCDGLTCRTVVDDRETPMGIYCRKNGKINPAATVLHEKSGRGPRIFLTLLMPVKPKSKPVRAIESAGNKVKVEFSDGRILHLEVPENGGRLQYRIEKKR